MSWSFNFLEELQRQIQNYRDQMLYIINSKVEISRQPELLRLSQELDQIIISYQNFNKILIKMQKEPFNAGFYMSTNVIIVKSYERIHLPSGAFALIEEEGEVKKIIDSCSKSFENFCCCNECVDINHIKEIINENNVDFVILLNKNKRPVGLLEKSFVNELCSQKTITAIETKIKIKSLFDTLPMSVFVLDKDLYIEYANKESLKCFKDILPREFLNKKAELIFGSLLSSNFKEFRESTFFNCLKALKETSDLEVKLLNKIDLLANIKLIKIKQDIEKVVLVFINVENLTKKVERVSYNADELAQAISLFFPPDVEYKLKEIIEYKDIFNYDKKEITIISKIDHGGYWHVINCLRLLSQLDRIGALEKLKLEKNTLITAIILHDIGKIQPDLTIGKSYIPQSVFESGRKHAFRSASYCKSAGYSRDILFLIKYHHHKTHELPMNFPKKLLRSLDILQLIDGLSAAITRRNATIRFEMGEDNVIIYEENRERLEYNKTHLVTF